MNTNCFGVSGILLYRMKHIDIDNYDLTAENDKLYYQIVLQIKTAKF